MNKPLNRFYIKNDNSMNWSAALFHEVFDFLSSKPISRDQLNYEAGVCKNIHYGDILTKLPSIVEYNYPILPYVNSDIDTSLFSSLNSGDIVIADTAEDYMVGTAVEVSVNDGEVITAGLHTMACRPKIKFAKSYLGYYLNSPAFHNQLKRLVTGTKVLAINKSEIINTVIKFPSFEEQQKIAEFFTALDEKIRLNATKLSNIRSLKSNIARIVLFQHKGIQLNSWVEVQLSDVAEFIKTRDTFDSCIYVGTEHLNKDFGGLCKEIKDTASGVVFKENDILLSNIRPYLKKLWLSDCKGVCSADVLVIRSKSTILPSLLKHILSTEVFFDYVAKGYKGSKMPRGDKDHIELFEFMIPSDLEVQRKIADQLDLFEMMIFCLIKKNKHLELLKKAFMQRMFV
ncbi:MAG: restriction endonuclease subunit S [Anaerobiospirillum succiniciproducens]|uniref:restriction endonuclease subunit S n=1 Tax=Anaerobiospirillum succiniciproducens TaxID=13335 RepID=UPI002A74FB9F|nr:restriction endonuclease subunit S [Anaerobiospirillum succiniciproducens]MDY2797966.1 restriction endonuclease subunit S [Anaerobiospirillum succiniciproducens]